MIAAAEAGRLTIEKLEAMTCVCSVGLDMIAVPGDTPAETISAIIADEAAIGMINNKTTAVRIIPAPGKHGGRHGGVRRPARQRAGHAGQPLQRGRVHRPRRAHPRPAAQPEKLRGGSALTQEKMDRISELTRIARERDLTPDEQAERKALREEYIADWRRSTIDVLENTYIDHGDGRITKLPKKSTEPCART